MLPLESCLLSQSRRLERIRLTPKSSMRRARPTQSKTQGSRFYSMSQGSRMECLTLKSGRCSRRVGKLKSNSRTKKTPYSQQHASKQCWIKVESWGLEHFAQSLAATRLNGNDFQCAARHGQAWLGKARPGVARRGAAWHGKHTASLWGCSSLLGAARHGSAGLGAAGLGGARRGKANTLHLFGDAAVCQARQGAARHGAARPGKAGQGTDWLGKANTRHLTGCRSLLKNY